MLPGQNVILQIKIFGKLYSLHSQRNAEEIFNTFSLITSSHIFLKLNVLCIYSI